MTVTSSKLSDSSACQAGILPCASKHLPRPLDLAFRFRKRWKIYGPLKTSQVFLNFLVSLFRARQPNPSTHGPWQQLFPDRPLPLQPGELVEVKAEDEILQTLDATGKLRGLAFRPAMRAFCGQRFTVLKRVERIYLEESAKTRTMRDTVLLTGVMCDGLPIGCDRSCFYYWRESWLRRVTKTHSS